MFYNLAFTKYVAVQVVMRSGLDVIALRRILCGETLEQWENLRHLVAEHEFIDCQDKVTWSHNGKSKFVVRELYLWLKVGRLVGYRSIWQLKIPNKVYIFLWLMIKNNILTKHKLVRTWWTGNEECHFCRAKESIDFFFDCAVAKMIWHVVTCPFGFPNIQPRLSNLMGNWIKSFPKDQREVVLCGGITICWTIWKTSNRACFDKIFHDDPTSLVYRLCSYINAWSVLQKTKTEEELSKE